MDLGEQFLDGQRVADISLDGDRAVGIHTRIRLRPGEGIRPAPDQEDRETIAQQSEGRRSADTGACTRDECYPLRHPQPFAPSVNLHSL
jgi:hypothetical protein